MYSSNSYWHSDPYCYTRYITIFLTSMCEFDIMQKHMYCLDGVYICRHMVVPWTNFYHMIIFINYLRQTDVMVIIYYMETLYVYISLCVSKLGQNDPPRMYICHDILTHLYHLNTMLLPPLFT